MIKPTSGHIYLDGEDLAHVSEQRMREIRLSKISMVFQQFGLFNHKTVAENVAYGLKMQGISKIERRQKSLEYLAKVGLEPWADRFPTDLSGGMKQRVGLARALATEEVHTILQSHAEGSSLRGVSRISGRASGTVVSLVRDAAQKSQMVHNAEVEQVTTEEIIGDEMS